MELPPQVVNKGGKIQKSIGSYRYKPKTRTERLAQRWERFLEKFDWSRAIGESLRDYQQDSTKFTALRKENILSDNFKGLRLMQQSNVELEREQDGQKQWGTFKRLLWRVFDNFVDDHVPMLQKAKEIPLFKHLVSAFYRSL
ncbi:hypothetical protein MIR68_006904 [Amoeboaphelidium protococcarum]|nr:hypothetical protein MIR68_006904 [Amoeboaphelidium protococcarum]